MARILPVVLITVLSLASSLQAESESRQWSDATGKFKIDAKLIEIKNGKAVLMKADGKKVEIPVEKLSTADQKHLEESANPFETSSTPEPASLSPPKGKGSAPWTAPDFKKLRQISGLSKKDRATWKFEPIPTASELADSVELPAFDFHDRPTGVLSVNGMWYVLSVSNPFKGHRLHLCNLKSGEVVASAVMDKEVKHNAVAVSPDGQFVLTAFDGWVGDAAGTASIWTVEGTELKRQFDWKPFETGDRFQAHKSGVKWGMFADPQRLLLMADGYVVQWDATTGRPAYQANLSARLLKLLPDGKHLLAVTDEAIGVMDVVAGKILFYKSMNVQGVNSIDVCPDGTKLLLHGNQGVVILDLASGESIKEIVVEGSNQDTIWAGNNHILIGGKDLLDVDREFVCWSYTGQRATFSAGGQVWFLAVGANESPSVLLSEELPHPEALERIQQAEADPDFFALKPGSHVNVSVLIEGGPADLQTTLLKKIEAAGYVYDNAAPISFVAKVEQGESREVAIRDFGSFRNEGVRKYNFQPSIASLQLVRDGTVLWSRVSGGYPPGMLDTRDGESEAAALKRYEAPNMGLYEHAVLPKFIVAQGKGGQTEITTLGLK